MNNIIFNTTEHTGLGSFILIIVLTVVLICVVFLITLFGLMNIISKLSRKNNMVFFTGCAIIVAILASLTFLSIHNFKPPKIDPTVYSDSNFTESHSLKLNDFNKVMKDKYDYKFELKNNNSQNGEPYYTATNLKTNKKSNRCYLDFEKLNNDKHQVKLVDVSCGNSIMQDIVKNKPVRK